MKRATCIFFVVVLATFGAAQMQAPISAPAAPTDGQSLQAYLLTMLQAEQRGDVETVQKLADELKLPDSAQWFRDAFGPDQTSSLSNNYDRSFVAFRFRLIKNFQWTENAPAEISVEYTNAPSVGIVASSTDPVPRTQVEIESFKCVLKAAGKGGQEWMDSYVRADGTLRYIGQGAHPFWVTPRVRVCSRTQMPKLKKQYAPNYPNGVRAHRVVTVLAEIGKDGHIHDAHVAQRGDPEFDAAAIDAVQRWIYEPATCDGAPITVKTSISVNFDTR